MELHEAVTILKTKPGGKALIALANEEARSGTDVYYYRGAVEQALDRINARS